MTSVLGTDHVHCAGSGYEAVFGRGTKLTVLGKKRRLMSINS